MASGEAVWALDQTVSVPHSQIDNPLEASWHICQGSPRVLQNSPLLEESKEGGGARKVLIPSFNMVICLEGVGSREELLQSLPSWTLEKETVFQSGDVFFKHLKLKTNESKYQVHSAM